MEPVVAMVFMTESVCLMLSATRTPPAAPSAEHAVAVQLQPAKGSVGLSKSAMEGQLKVAVPHGVGLIGTLQHLLEVDAREAGKEHLDEDGRHAQHPLDERRGGGQASRGRLGARLLRDENDTERQRDERAPLSTLERAAEHADGAQRRREHFELRDDCEG
eukprot:6205333-Pleurochrysis_carterae.AAC.3